MRKLHPSETPKPTHLRFFQVIFMIFALTPRSLQRGFSSALLWKLISGIRRRQGLVWRLSEKSSEPLARGSGGNALKRHTCSWQGEWRIAPRTGRWSRHTRPRVQRESPSLTTYWSESTSSSRPSTLNPTPGVRRIGRPRWPPPFPRPLLRYRGTSIVRKHPPPRTLP